MPDFLGSDHINGLKTQYTALQKGLETTRKEGEGTPQLAALEESLKTYGDMDAKLKELAPLAGKIELTDKRVVNLRANLAKATDDSRKAYTAIMAIKTKKWTVETNSKVASWVSTHSEPSLARVTGEIKTLGVEAGGLRKIVGNCYDVHCTKASDYRLVGTADEANKKFKFEAVYRHPKSGGKEFVDGTRVSAYG
jgi:hypothetical protein